MYFYAPTPPTFWQGFPHVGHLVLYKLTFTKFSSPMTKVTWSHHATPRLEIGVAE